MQATSAARASCKHIANASVVSRTGSARTVELKAVGVSGGTIPGGVFSELAGSPAETAPIGVSGETDSAGTSAEPVTVGFSGETVRGGVSGGTDPADPPGKT